MCSKWGACYWCVYDTVHRNHDVCGLVKWLGRKGKAVLLGVASRAPGLNLQCVATTPTVHAVKNNVLPLPQLRVQSVLWLWVHRCMAIFFRLELVPENGRSGIYSLWNRCVTGFEKRSTSQSRSILRLGHWYKARLPLFHLRFNSTFCSRDKLA